MHPGIVAFGLLVFSGMSNRSESAGCHISVMDVVRLQRSTRKLNMSGRRAATTFAFLFSGKSVTRRSSAK